MLLVLDSNEFIFALGFLPKSSCRRLIDALLHGRTPPLVRIPRTIVQEVLRHLTPEGSREFFSIIRAVGEMDEDDVVPFALGSKYEAQGFKPADAFIAAYTEWVGADALVTENRHFLSRQSDLPFKVLSAETCLTLISPSH